LNALGESVNLKTIGGEAISKVNSPIRMIRTPHPRIRINLKFLRKAEKMKKKA
jgi:hypothetical protein